MALRVRQVRGTCDIASEEVALASRSVEDVQGHWLRARLGKRAIADERGRSRAALAHPMHLTPRPKTICEWQDTLVDAGLQIRTSRVAGLALTHNGPVSSRPEVQR